ncbi:transposase [Cupriavidus sp. BIS7]|uniref:transposase n=1 Tax=Cupriavidus sp. BIS7 TaxID=1217718 RepID=UPI0024780A9F|nr:transposase [Cupriavidus sp. BIS7]
MGCRTGGRPSGGIRVNRRYSEEQIRMYLDEAARGVPVRELCARYGFSDASFYGWRAKYGRTRQHDPSDTRRLRQLEEENARLKSMLADALLKLELLRNRTGRHGDGKGHA